MTTQRDYGSGLHRVPLETTSPEVHLRDHVEAVSVRNNPITEIVPDAVKPADRSLFERGGIIMAQRWDAGSGALTRIGIRGRDAMTLKEGWQKDIRTTLGLQKRGFPNPFVTGAALASAAALCNSHAEWITRDQGDA